MGYRLIPGQTPDLILTAIEREGPLTAARLVEITGGRQRSISGALIKLKNHGLIAPLRYQRAKKSNLCRMIYGRTAKPRPEYVDEEYRAAAYRAGRDWRMRLPGSGPPIDRDGSDP